jgi:hypothetical protein
MGDFVNVIFFWILFILNSEIVQFEWKASSILLYLIVLLSKLAACEHDLVCTMYYILCCIMGLMPCI